MKIEPHQPITFTKSFHDYAAIAIEAHGLQMYGDRPYAYHLAQVENVLAEYGFQENHYRAAAWLHDTIEDTDVTAEQITILFNLDVARMVWACTGQGKSRAEKTESILRRIKEIPEAGPLKCADRIANLTYSIASKNKSKIEMYLAEWSRFAEVLKPIMSKECDKRSPMLFIDLEDLHEKAKQTLASIKKEEEGKVNGKLEEK